MFGLSVGGNCRNQELPLLPRMQTFISISNTVYTIALITVCKPTSLKRLKRSKEYQQKVKKDKKGFEVLKQCGHTFITSILEAKKEKFGPTKFTFIHLVFALLLMLLNQSAFSRNLNSQPQVPFHGDFSHNAFASAQRRLFSR